MNDDDEGEDGDVFGMLGLERRYRAQFIFRPMKDIAGQKRTLVMGVVLGDFCPDKVDRIVDASLTIKILAAERARLRGGTHEGIPGHVTDDWQHGSLLDSGADNAKLWEAEPGFQRVARARTKAQREREAFDRAAWPRVIKIKHVGYDCDAVRTGISDSPHQRHAERRTPAELEKRLAALRAQGLKCWPVRLRPRAK